MSTQYSTPTMTQPSENLDSTLTQSIQHLTLAELETLIEKIVKRTLQEKNSHIIPHNLLKGQLQTASPPQAFLETFGSWEDTRTPEEIISEIYGSRILDRNENNL
ncbi:MAG: hypothetical protein AB4426_25210 [Xenococcaceae cyanobacterium]